MATRKTTSAPSPVIVKSDSGHDRPEIDAARNVFAMASDGLAALSASLDGVFLAAVDTLSTLKGRVIVSGMGKSGHIGHKIAATLASTGTPAFFVHPAEASHGDLGMITEEDAVLALSNSGETPELTDLVSYSRRFGIPLIAITGRARSTLAEAADHVLLLPDVPEACPLGLAPTTSTTLMIAVGDALSVALLQRRGFTADDYKIFHPGGKLGRNLLKVADLMHTGGEIPIVQPGSPMSETILVMTEKTFGIAGVVDADSALIGIVTDGDLRRHMASDLFNMTTAEVMTSKPKAVTGSMLAAEALRRMNEWKITSLFVVDDGKPVGILRMHDILRAGVV